MAKKIKYIARDADGQLHTRSSNRVYTHTVVAKLDIDAMIRDADTTGRAYSIQNHAVYVGYATNGWKPTKWMTPESAKQHHEKGFECGRRFLAEHGTDPAAYAEVCYQRKVARFTADTEYHNLGWCGRLDLAQKLAAKCAANQYTKYRDVTILEAETAA